MIKLKTDKHEYAYFLYAITKSFFKDAPIVPPDKASHNMLPDDEGENEDLIECFFDDESLFKLTVKSGNILPESEDREWEIDASLDEEERKYARLGFVYDFLCEYTGIKLPWGNLTGIRPTKLYLNKLIELQMEKDGNDYPFDEDTVTVTKKYMADNFRVSEEKGELAISIAEREQGLMKSLHSDDGYSLYIGIPFCPSTCLYCSFTSYPIFKYRKIVPEYLECLKKEMAEAVKLMDGKILDTIYIGGGTPTSLSAEELDVLLSAVTEIMPLDHLKEFTVEAGRPDSITIDKLKVMKKYPVNRISVNPQTMNDKTLQAIGRAHTVAQYVDAFKLAREEGFDNINTDIILGLKGEDVSDVEYTLNRLKELNPDSLTVHSLAIKRASRLKLEMDLNGTDDFRNEFDFEKAMGLASKAASDMGMNPYYLYRQKDMGGNLENTGFARDGKYGLYNILMMEEVQSIYAVGAGTVTKRVYGNGRIERCDAVKDVKMYIDNIEDMIDRKRKLFAD